MCSLLVWARRDNTTGFARGEVIEIHEEDNFHWGDAIMGPNSLGMWRCIEVPGTPSSAMLSLQLNDKTGKRTCFLDLDALEAQEEDLVHWDILVITNELANAAIRMRPLVVAAKFGEHPSVLG